MDIDGIEVKKDFGSWVQDKRTRRGLRQTDLAQRVKIPRKLYQNDISMLERGVKFVDIELIVGICQALEVTESEFREMTEMLLNIIKRKLD